MSAMHALRVTSAKTAVVAISKKKKLWQIRHVDSYDDVEAAKKALKKKKALFLSLGLDDIVNEKVTLPSMMTNPKVIRHAVSAKLEEDFHISEKVLLNVQKISEETDEHESLYQVDGLYLDEYNTLFKVIPSSEHVKFATSEHFALFSLSEQCLDQESYICVFTEEDRNTVIAVHRNKLIFSRISSVAYSDEEQRRTALLDDINRSIAYINHQYRDTAFDLLALSGPIVEDEAFCEQLQFQAGMHTAVLYPASLFRGLNGAACQEWLPALGMLTLPAAYSFIPEPVKAARQYYFAQNTLLVSSVFILFFSFLAVFEQFSSYSRSMDEYYRIKEKLYSAMRITHTLPLEQLQEHKKHLDLAEQTLQHHPVDAMIRLKPLVDLLQPKSWQWEMTESGPALDAGFERQFETLNALYQFEKRFKKRVEHIDKGRDMEVSYQTDYRNMLFKTTVKIGVKPSAPRQSSRRRRRP